MPHRSLDSFFFWNSGSEAVEGAIKMARMITGKQNIISMQGAYHGRTMGAVAVTKSKTGYSEGTHPLMVRIISTHDWWGADHLSSLASLELPSLTGIISSVRLP